MPWTAAQAAKHKKGLSPKQRAQWAKVANHVLQTTGNDAIAIRTANAKVGAKKRKA